MLAIRMVHAVDTGVRIAFQLSWLSQLGMDW
jgi:hypothetical protein